MPHTRIFTRSNTVTGGLRKNGLKLKITEKSSRVSPGLHQSADDYAVDMAGYSVQGKYRHEFSGQRSERAEAAGHYWVRDYNPDYHPSYKLKQKRLLVNEEGGCAKRSDVVNCVDNSKYVLDDTSDEITHDKVVTNFIERVEDKCGSSPLNGHISLPKRNTLNSNCSRYLSKVYFHRAFKRDRVEQTKSHSVNTNCKGIHYSSKRGLQDIAKSGVRAFIAEVNSEDKQHVCDNNYVCVNIHSGIPCNNFRKTSVCPFNWLAKVSGIQDTQVSDATLDLPNSTETAKYETVGSTLDSLQVSKANIGCAQCDMGSFTKCRHVDIHSEVNHGDSDGGLAAKRAVEIVPYSYLDSAANSVAEIVANSAKRAHRESADAAFSLVRAKTFDNLDILETDTCNGQVGLSQGSDNDKTPTGSDNDKTPRGSNNNKSPTGSNNDKTPTGSELTMTSLLRDGGVNITCSVMTLSTRPSRHKTRRRSKRTPAGKVDALFLQTSTCDASFQTITALEALEDSDNDKREADPSLDQSSSPASSLDQTTISKFSSAERLRQCSSPSFIYDPEIARQIPFYFTDPDIEDLREESFLSYSWLRFPPLESGFDSLQLENREFVEWEEFDDNLRSDEVDVGACVPSVYVVGVNTCNESADNTSSNSVQSDEIFPTDSCSDVSEIDYDNYLPAHVLMHVKRDLVSVLMEYGQTREVKVAFKDMERSGPHHASRFHTAAIVDGETFPVGSGSSKKNAKKAAAAQALKIMYDRGRKNLEVVNEVAHKKLKAMSDEEVGSHAHRVVLVSRHVLDTAEETQFINYSKDKIAATFVLEYHGRMRVVGLGTGNRCILYQHLTLDGKRVIHSHAEIIARRAFLRYLYKQLLTYNGNRSHPIFTRSDTGKLKLRDKIQVHLYISRPPCGDAAAFPTISNFPNKMRAIRKQGQLRTIIDDGEGAIPTDFSVPAGANGKERLRIMTCSDKICRWNVLGVQGALLSHFLDPIYVSSLVIGSHTGDQRGHVPRAVSGRLKCGRLHEVIQRPFHINTPDIHYPHDDLADNYNITKSKQYCITWSYGDSDAEVIDAITGVTNMETMEEVIPSRVSKITLYNLFHQVCKKYGQHDLASLDYVKAKRAATTFQRMKNFVGQHLAAMGFGQWYSLQDTYGTDSLTCPGPC